ncbi:MAG: hypothetical protein C0622_00335 [Desulfuromonas sp.]|nr:MAG: hypothetical protein C0622_00335 [Desulfuromonas sp.]
MKRIICLILFWTLTATLVTGLPTGAAAAGNPAIDLGRQLYQAGELKQALSVLRNVIQHNPGGNDSFQASILIGRILTDQQQYADALLYLERIPRGLRTPEAKFLLGNALIHSEQDSEALELLRPLLDESFSNNDRALLYRDLATASARTGAYLQALFFLNRQLSFSAQPATLLAEAHDILQNRIGDSDLAEAAFMWQGTEIGQDARLQLARRALVRQQPELARQHLNELFASPVGFPYWEEAELLQQRTAADSWLSRDSIGVMLPLSGPYASYGELVKKGLELALGEHNKTRLPLRFAYRDTAVEGVSPAALVSSLSDDEKVMAIIGPLLAASAENAAQRAQQEMVPMLALTQADRLPDTGNFIFRDTMTARQQVKTLIDYAIANDNISFSVLYPENRFGRRMTELFIAELEKAGGELVDVVSYPEDNNDFKKQTYQLLWERDGERRDAEPDPDMPELEYPLAPFHALFIPDYAERINQVAPQLMFYGLKDVTLLGISGWNSAELAERSGRFLKDAVFVDAFFAESSKPEVKRFIELFRQTYHEEPTILEAQAFDAATLLLNMLDDPTVTNREDLRRKLASLDDFRGITGTTGFSATGEALKDLELLTFKRGRIVEVR